MIFFLSYCAASIKRITPTDASNRKQVAEVVRKINRLESLSNEEVDLASENIKNLAFAASKIEEVKNLASEIKAIMGADISDYAKANLAYASAKLGAYSLLPELNTEGIVDPDEALGLALENKVATGLAATAAGGKLSFANVLSNSDISNKEIKDNITDVKNGLFKTENENISRDGADSAEGENVDKYFERVRNNERAILLSLASRGLAERIRLALSMAEDPASLLEARDSAGHNILHIMSKYYTPIFLVEFDELYREHRSLLTPLLEKTNSDGYTPYELAILKENVSFYEVLTRAFININFGNDISNRKVLEEHVKLALRRKISMLGFVQSCAFRATPSFSRDANSFFNINQLSGIGAFTISPIQESIVDDLGNTILNAIEKRKYNEALAISEFSSNAYLSRVGRGITSPIINNPNSDRLNILQILSNNPSDSLFYKRVFTDLISRLEKLGANFNITFPLIDVISNGGRDNENILGVEAIINSGVDLQLNETDRKDRTALWVAVEQKRVDAFRLLLKAAKERNLDVKQNMRFNNETIFTFLDSKRAVDPIYNEMFNLWREFIS